MTAPMTGARIVVGVDGSEQSLQGLDWGLDEARRRHLPVEIVHAWMWPLYGVPLGPPPYGPADSGLRASAEAVLRDAARRAEKVAPGVRVGTSLSTGAPAPALVNASEDASLVVLGCRGLGGFAGLLLGSTSSQVAAHARCPVTVVRGQERPAGPVVVGVDGSATGQLAVAAAFLEASLRGGELIAVHTWVRPVSTGPQDPLPLVFSEAEMQQAEEAVLAESLAGWEERYPDVTVTERVVRDHPAHYLSEMSARAQLLVVGSRGRGGFPGLRLGSVSRAVLHHADSPVMVVRPVGEAEQPTDGA